MVVTLPGPPSPSTSMASIMPMQALVKMDTLPEKATFHSSSTDTATGYSSVTLPTTIVATSRLTLISEELKTKYWSLMRVFNLLCDCVCAEH